MDKSFLLLFFKKEELLFLKKKKQKNFYLLGVFLLVAAAPKIDPALRLQQMERARAAQLATAQQAAEAKAQAAARADALAQQRADQAARLRVLETQVDDTARQLAAARDARAAAEAEIDRRTVDLNALLPLALRLSLYPSETILAAPAPPDQALEGLLITHGLAAELARQVNELRRRQAEAAALEATITAAQSTLAAQRARQRAQATALDQQITAAQETIRAASQESGAAALQASLLAAKAADLRGAIASMMQAQQQAAARAAQDAARGLREKGGAARARLATLSTPAGPGLSGAARVTLVAGRVVRAWGAPAEDGPATGVTFGTAPGAYVSSPCTGRVGFAGPFRSYGRLIILECGGGYDFVLAGLDRLDASLGTRVRAGEPVGRMPDYDPAKSADRPGLYVELRRGGQPVDPMPFLGSRK
jgi:septal ring factor EnvC (AmiA/AmiB activator)